MGVEPPQAPSVLFLQWWGPACSPPMGQWLSLGLPTPDIPAWVGAFKGSSLGSFTLLQGHKAMFGLSLGPSLNLIPDPSMVVASLLCSLMLANGEEIAALCSDLTVLLTDAGSVVWSGEWQCQFHCGPRRLAWPCRQRSVWGASPTPDRWLNGPAESHLTFVSIESFSLLSPQSKHILDLWLSALPDRQFQPITKIKDGHHKVQDGWPHEGKDLHTVPELGQRQESGKKIEEFVVLYIRESGEAGAEET